MTVPGPTPNYRWETQPNGRSDGHYAGFQTDSSTIRDTVAAQSVQDLPLNGRNYITLVATAPGAAAGPSNSIISGTRPDDRRQTSAVVANGQNETFNNHLVDGMDNNEREQFSILYRPSIDSLEEVKIDTKTFPAEEGRAGGAVINLITKSGHQRFSRRRLRILPQRQTECQRLLCEQPASGARSSGRTSLAAASAALSKRTRHSSSAISRNSRQIQGKNTGITGDADCI